MCACKPLKSLLSQKKFWGGYFIALFACASLGEATTWFAVAYAFFVISIALTSYGYNRSVMKEQAAKAKKTPSRVRDTWAISVIPKYPSISFMGGIRSESIKYSSR